MDLMHQLPELSSQHSASPPPGLLHYRLYPSLLTCPVLSSSLLSFALLFLPGLSFLLISLSVPSSFPFSFFPFLLYSLPSLFSLLSFFQTIHHEDADKNSHHAPLCHSPQPEPAKLGASVTFLPPSSIFLPRSLKMRCRGALGGKGWLTGPPSSCPLNLLSPPPAPYLAWGTCFKTCTGTSVSVFKAIKGN